MQATPPAHTGRRAHDTNSGHSLVATVPVADAQISCSCSRNCICCSQPELHLRGNVVKITRRAPVVNTFSTWRAAASKTKFMTLPCSPWRSIHPPTRRCSVHREDCKGGPPTQATQATRPPFPLYPEREQGSHAAICKAPSYPCQVSWTTPIESSTLLSLDTQWLLFPAGGMPLAPPTGRDRNPTTVACKSRIPPGPSKSSSPVSPRPCRGSDTPDQLT